MSATAILFVDHATALGGAQHCSLLLWQQLDRAAFAPHLATPPGELADAAERAGVRVHRMPLPRLRSVPLGPWRLARGTAALGQLVRRERIALVHHNSMRASFYATLAGRLSRRPVVWHVHDIFPRGLYARSMCSAAAAVIAVSSAVAAPLPCRNKIRVVPNGVRIADFEADHGATAARLRAAWGVPEGATVIGHVARLQPWKGQRDVLAVAEAVLREFPDVYFVFVGGDIFNDAGGFERELKATAARRGLSQRVVFAGHQAKMVQVLQALDIVVHASVDEPFGRILIEAGAAALPVVAYASGGVPEIVVHEQTGLLAAAGDRSALALGVVRLIRTPALARTLGRAARVRVEQQFEVGRLTREIEEVFRRALRA